MADFDNLGKSTNSENLGTLERVEVSKEGLDKTINDIGKADKITKEHYQIEKTQQLAYSKFFDNNFDDIWSGFINIKDFLKFEDFTKSNSTKLKEDINNPISNPTEVKQTNKESGNEKEKVKEYATLANLSYARFEKVNKDGETNLSNLKVKEVNLDIASIDFTKFSIDSSGKLVVSDLTKLSPDEKFVISYFNNEDNFKDKKNMLVDINDRNISDIFRVADYKIKQKPTSLVKLKEVGVQLADNDIVTSDADKGYSLKGANFIEEPKVQKFSDFIKTNRPKLNEALIKLKESKTSDYQKQFDSFKEKRDFKILTYYPEENSNDKSGFQCVLFEKDGKKILSITGTQLTDIGDIGEDIAILSGKVPKAQTKSMIDFFRKNLNGSDEVTIVGHSLGGTLSQIASSIYGENSKISETYTFNSPGAKELEIPKDENSQYQKEFKDLKNNRESDIIGNKITNVKGTKGINIIAELGVDIGNYRIDVKTSSHSIMAILEAIEKVDKLVRYRIDEAKKYF